MAVNWTTLSGAKTVEGSIKNWVNRTDIPITNILIEVQAYIYNELRDQEMSRSEKITFKDNTGTATGSGTSTALADTSGVFNDGHVVVGDTVTNTTDGSTATVSTIDSATAITTSALTGGTDNTWTSGDTYTFKNSHRLDIADILSGANITSFRFLEPISLIPYGESRPRPYINEAFFNPPTDESGDLFTGTDFTNYTIMTDQIRLDTSLTSDVSAVFKYWAAPADLSGSNETNFLTIRYPEMFRYYLMAAAFQHMKENNQQQYYFNLAEKLMSRAKVNADRIRGTQQAPAGPADLDYEIYY